MSFKSDYARVAFAPTSLFIWLILYNLLANVPGLC